MSKRKAEKYQLGRENRRIRASNLDCGEPVCEDPSMARKKTATRSPARKKASKKKASPGRGASAAKKAAANKPAKKAAEKKPVKKAVKKKAVKKAPAPAGARPSPAGRPARSPRRSATPSRRASVERTTRETSVFVDLNLDGSGASTLSTGVPFLDHMPELWSRHGFFDLVVRATGDLEVDQHHTVEDVGLTLGQVFREALGDKVGIRRFGQTSVPLDEALVSVVVDLSGRPYLVYELDPGSDRVGDFDTGLVHDFLLSFINEVRMNLHIDCIRGRNPHHMIEAMFKGLGRALDGANQFDPRVHGVLSTKGVL